MPQYETGLLTAKQKCLLFEVTTGCNPLFSRIFSFPYHVAVSGRTQIHNQPIWSRVDGPNVLQQS